MNLLSRAASHRFSLPIPFRGRTVGSPTHRRGSARLAAAAGFTIVELVVYAALSSIVIGAASATISSSIRSNAQSELNQRSNDSWGRLSAFLEAEVNEGTSVAVGSVGVTVSCAGVTEPALFRITLPNTTVFAQNRGVRTIEYFVTGAGAAQELRRCGPPILANGQLDLAPASVNVNSLVSSPTNLAATVDAAGTQLNFTASFRDVNGNVVATRNAVARTRTRPIS
jgi:hypothetical protein